MGKALQEIETRNDQPTFDEEDVAARVKEEFRISRALEASDTELGAAVSQLEGAARAHVSLGSSRTLLELLRSAVQVVLASGATPAP
jgi:hypothetical protein